MIKKHLATILTVFILTSIVQAQEFYVNPTLGSDTNNGSLKLPLKTIAEASRLANQLTGTGSITIKLLPGIYVLEDKVSINPIRIFNDTSRYIIEAHVMPDDVDWHPEKMPVIQSVSANNSSTFFNHSVGLLVASSRVTLRGLKFVGNSNPLVSYYYPITKEDKSLPDLEVSQCIFIGDKEAAKIQGGIWAHGQDNIVDHCVFYACRNAVLFFDNVGGFQIKNTIVYKAYESAFWLGPEDIDFEFYNNIISDNGHIIVGRSDDLQYSSALANSVITNNDAFVGYWSRDQGQIIDIKNPKVVLVDIIDKGVVKINENQAAVLNKMHLHLHESSIGFDRKAGIFKK